MKQVTTETRQIPPWLLDIKEKMVCGWPPNETDAISSMGSSKKKRKLGNF